MSSELTVITCAYNKGERLKQTIESVLSQSMGDFDYIVIDDGSTDGTADLLREYHDDRLRVVHQPNTGFTKTLAAYLRNITTPYIAIQGAGDISLPDRFGKQLRFLISHQDVVAVGCDREDRDKHGNLLKPSHLPCRRLTGQAEAIKRNILNHGEAMFKTSDYFRAGGYRPFFTYAQDRDLWLRLIKYGDIASIPELLYVRIMDPQHDVTGNPARSLQQSQFSQYAIFLAQGDLNKQWDNQTIDPAERHGDFLAAMGESGKRAMAARVCSQIRASRLPVHLETARLADAERIVGTLAPGSWMARELGFRRFLLRASPTLFIWYFNLRVQFKNARRGRLQRRITASGD